MKLHYYLLFILAILVYSCGAPEKKQAPLVNKPPAPDSALTKGICLDGIPCRKDPTQNYSLYIPTHYTPAKNWPIIYAFDAHGAGKMAVDKYKELAEHYGYILVASNSSKNGLSGDAIVSIVTNLFDDSQERLHIDRNRIYTAGFSGGSRIACSIALNSGIAGVIACSAGFPADQALPAKVCFIGFAGNADMNLLEMENLNHKLDQSKLPHEFITFEGKHEWPPAEVLSDAFAWFEMNAMKDQRIARNDSLIKSFIQVHENKMNQFMQLGKSFEAYKVGKQLINYLNGLSDVGSYKRKCLELDHGGKIQQTILENIQLEKKELAKQQEYQEAVASKDINWWKKEVGNLSNPVKDEKNGGNGLLNKRLLSYLSLQMYMYANHTLNNNQLEQAAYFLTLYKLVDPENTEAYYLSAQLFARQGDLNKATLELKEAQRLGFDDQQRLQQDPLLRSIRL